MQYRETVHGGVREVTPVAKQDPLQPANVGGDQIPLDLVVKYQAVDITEVMFYRSGAGPSSTHHVATGNRGVSRSHHCKITGLPLNLGECGLPCFPLGVVRSICQIVVCSSSVKLADFSVPRFQPVWML